MSVRPALSLAASALILLSALSSAAPAILTAPSSAGPALLPAPSSAAIAILTAPSSAGPALLPAFAPAALSLPQEHSTAGRAAERPDHDGPYNASFLIERFKGSTKSYSINLKVFYPAAGASENATPNASGAPYPTILMMPYAGSDEGAYDFIAPRFVSWGMVCVVVGVSQSDPWNSGNATDVEDMLDQLENDNATPSHKLAGMVDRGAFGISGHSFGGAKSIIGGCSVPRLRAVQAMAPALYSGDIDTLAATFRKPYQVQIGRLDTTLYEVAQYSYQQFPAPKAILDLAGIGHGGPFLWDLAIAFFFHHLRGLKDYETFIYGDSALNDAADLFYYLNFTHANGTYFPPGLDIQASTLKPFEDQRVDFTARYGGWLPLGHPRGTLNWDLDSDGLPERSGAYELTVNSSYPQEAFVTIRMWYQLGKLYLWASNTITLHVTNLPPHASAGANITPHEDEISAAEDEPIGFSGEGGDTPSDMAGLAYSWSFGDGSSVPYGSEPNATHAYAKKGNYTATFAVRDGDGAVGTDSLRVTISNVPPSTSPVADMTVWKDSEAHFSGKGNDTASDLPNLTCSWDFGDGGSSEWSRSPEADHTYTRSGSFQAAFRVRDDNGAAARWNFTVTVLNAPPLVSVSAPPESEQFQKDEAVSFRGLAADTPTDAPLLRFRWDFGDGNLTGWSGSPLDSHTYTRGGRYAAVLSALDPEGAIGAATVNLTIRNAPPAATVLSPSAGALFNEDENIRFLAEAADTESDLPFLQYAWAIDDIEWTGPQQLVSFWTEGAHHYAVTVRDAEGAATTVRGTLNIRNQAPRLVATVTPLQLYVNGSVEFSANATDTASDLPVLSFSWSFGDGTTSANASGAHAYNRSGTYQVRVAAEDDEGAASSLNFTVTVLPPPAPPDGDGAVPAPGGPPTFAIIAAVGAALTAVLVKMAFVLRRRRRPQG